MMTEREFWKFTMLCLRILWLHPPDFSLTTLYRIYLTGATVVLFCWKRYPGYL